MDKATKNMGPILWYALAGGEVFIRKDVPKIIDVIKNTNVKYLSIPSNGWYTDRMYNSVLDILRKHPDLLFQYIFLLMVFLIFMMKSEEKIHFKKLKVL